MVDKISEVFDIDPIPPTPLPVVESKPDNISGDSEYARQNLKTLMATASTALQHALDLAVQSDSPRAYEVLATLINTSAELNTKLLDTHQREQKLTGAKEEEKVTTQNITNNVVFSGTTHELNQLIMKRLNNDKTI